MVNCCSELQLTHDHAYVPFTALLLIHAVTLNSLSTIFIWVPQLLGDMDYVIFIWVHRIQKSDSLFRLRGFQSLCTPLLSSKVCMKRSFFWLQNWQWCRYDLVVSLSLLGSNLNSQATYRFSMIDSVWFAKTVIWIQLSILMLCETTCQLWTPLSSTL
jgi:hypothetical protein